MNCACDPFEFFPVELSEKPQKCHLVWWLQIRSSENLELIKIPDGPDGINHFEIFLTWSVFCQFHKLTNSFPHLKNFM